MNPEAEQTVEAAIERLREKARNGARATNAAMETDRYTPDYFQSWRDAELIEGELKRLRAALEKASDPTWPRQ